MLVGEGGTKWGGEKIVYAFGPEDYGRARIDKGEWMGTVGAGWRAADRLEIVYRGHI